MCLYRTVWCILHTPYSSLSTQGIKCMHIAHWTIFICFTSIPTNSIDIRSLTFHSHTYTFFFVFPVHHSHIPICFYGIVLHFVFVKNSNTSFFVEFMNSRHSKSDCKNLLSTCVFRSIHNFFFFFILLHLLNGSVSVFMVSIKMHEQPKEIDDSKIIENYMSDLVESLWLRKLLCRICRWVCYV